MDNLKIIELSLQSLEDLKRLLMSLKTRPCIVFSEQKKTVDILTKILLNMWTLDIAADRQTLKTVASSSEEHDLEWDKLELDKENQDSVHGEQITRQEVSKVATSLVDKFFTLDEDIPVIYTPIESLAGAVGISDKFLFIKELFSGNEKEFTKALVRMDNMSDLVEAQQYFATVVLIDNNKDSYAAKQFGNLLIRRYMPQ